MEEEDFAVHYEGAYLLCGILSPQELIPIKLAYDTRQSDGWPH